MGINKVTRLLLSMAMATMLVGFTASAHQDAAKAEQKKEMKKEKAEMKKGHNHKAMKAKGEKKMKEEKKEAPQQK